MVVRPRVVWVLVRRELARVRGGEAGSRLRAVALSAVLLGGAALLPAGGLGRAPVQATVHLTGGPASPALRAVLEAAGLSVHEGPRAQDEDGGPARRGHTLDLSTVPPTLHSPRPPPRLRTALDALPSTPLPVLRRSPAPALPPQPRALLLLLIAVSLLTGPLTESLPGERVQHTWETLRAAAVSQAEIIVGKWLAWTAVGCGGVALAVVAAVLRGTLPLSPALIGLPLSIALSVALGLWLVAPSADPAGSATVPVRVIPLVVALLGGAAWMLAPGPAAALVPLGSALVLAMGGTATGLLPGAVLSSTVALGLLLWGAARRSLQPSRSSDPWPVLPLVLAAGAQLVLGSWGPGRLGGHAELAALAVAGIHGATAAVLALRRRGAPPPRHSGARAVGTGLAAGLSLAALPLVLSPGAALVSWPAPTALGAALVLGAVAEELLFRGALLRHGAGAVAAGAVLWWLATGLHTPVLSAALAVGLTAAALAGGTRAAVLARLLVLAAGGLV
jgi:hypothetical protein